MSDFHNSPESLPSLRSAIANVCRDKGVPDPSRWLASVMAGTDPRPVEAPILEMVRRIAYREFDEDDSEGTPYPDQSEWEAIVAHVLGSGLYKHAQVSIQESHKAATKLMDFLHKAQKTMDLSVEIETVEATDLTKDEILRVRKLIDDVF